MTPRQILEIGEVRGRLSIQKAAKLSGVSEATYSRRKADPGTLRVEELRALVRPMGLSDEDILNIIKGGTRT